MKGDALVGLRKIYIALARFIYRRLSFTVGDSVPAFRIKLSANDLNCVDELLYPTHSLILTCATVIPYYGEFASERYCLQLDIAWEYLEALYSTELLHPLYVC